MKIYYKVTYNADNLIFARKKTLYFINSVYMKDYCNGFRLTGISLTYKKTSYYQDFPSGRSHNTFMVPLSIDEIKNTIKKYGSLL